MKKTKLFALLTSLTLLTAAFAGCGSKDDGKTTTEPTAVTTESTTEATTASTESTEATTEGTTAADTTASGTTSADTTGTVPAGNDSAETEGTIDGKDYTNEYYNFKMTLPENWAYLNHEDTIAVMYQSMATLYEDADALKQMLEQTGTDYLFYAYSETGDEAGNVPNIIAQSLPVAGIGTYSLSEVVDQTLASTVMQYEQLGGKTDVTDAVSKDIDGHEFVTADSKTVLSITAQDGTATEMTVNQKYAAFKTDTHVIMLVVSYYADADETAASDAINSITFLK